MKVSIIGAGNVGSALAERVLAHNLADVVLVDIAGNLARAKALDISDAAPLMGYKKTITGTNNYQETSGSSVVVITAGFPRQPGMSRDALIKKNRIIVSAVTRSLKEFTPGAILIVVTNPLDVMTYLAYKETACQRQRILGMAGNLDTARFKVLLAQETGAPPEKIETFVMGSHGDTMVPLLSRTRVEGKPLEEILKPETIEKIVESTKMRGGEIVGFLKSGSAYFSPSAACLEILRSLILDEKKVIPCSAILNGEYGVTDCAIGVPAKIGKDGIEEILEWELPNEELSALRKSAKAVRDILNKL
ncbi:MAG: malate dehydrogenase [Candidatus Omnitrophota bacterium]